MLVTLLKRPGARQIVQNQGLAWFRQASSKALVFSAPGEPEEVLKLQEQQFGAPGADEVEVRVLMAPINPSDINTVQGKYPISPPLPGVPGHEGVGEVVSVGAKVQGLTPGDRVVPLEPALGTWRERGVFKARALHRLSTDISLEAAAMLTINPPTALALLEQFEQLQPGDVVIQNGATSGVGQAVIQLARAKGLKTINLIRDRPDWDQTVAFLKELGADVVTTEAKMKADLKAAGLPAPKLGLNCVGGSSALAVAKVLQESGTHVTYGGMSMQPVTVPTSLLIFKDLAFRGFWLSGRFARQQGPEQRGRVLDRLAHMIKQGKLKPSKAQLFGLEQYKEAFAAAKQGMRSHKVLFSMQQ